MKKGEDSFYRKASPGSWSIDLDPNQIETIEEICEPVLAAFYSGDVDLTLLQPSEHDRVPRRECSGIGSSKPRPERVHPADPGD